jgi:hypothetical protein
MSTVAASEHSPRQTPGILKRHWPLIVSLGILWAGMAILLAMSIGRNQGHFIYPLDDAYIHMAMAKNLSQHGVWGVTPYGFTSSSSSPAWTLLLSFVYLVVGVNQVAPFVLNVVFATLTVWLAYALLRRYDLPPVYNLATLLAILVFTPLLAMTFLGMESILAPLLTIALVYIAARILYQDGPSRREWLSLLILAPVLTSVRYEGMFVVLVVAVLLVIRRRWKQSLTLLALGLVPILVYGVISTSLGWYFLPNPVLVKSAIPAGSLTDVAGYFRNFFNNVVRAAPVGVLALIALVLLCARFFSRRALKTLWGDSTTAMLAIFVATCLLHMFFAKTGSYWRYEAYLVALGLLVVAVGLRAYLPTHTTRTARRELLAQRLALLVLGVILVFTIAERGVWGSLKVPQVTTNIYQQQYQMGKFVREFYEGESVAANDIGAVSYLADVRLLDLWGLGTLDVAQARLDGSYDTEMIATLTEQADVEVALVYDSWFDRYGGLPSEWAKVGEWTIPNNIICGNATVSIYAVRSEEEAALIQNLRSFSSRLPPDVQQSGPYLADTP